MHLVDAARVHGLPREHVVVERAERVQVRALVDRLAVDLLGRDELGDARDLVGGRHRQREVDQLDVLTGEQDVLRREIAVDDADLRGLDQRLADHLDQVRGVVERDRTARGDRLGERLRTFEELHGDPGLVAALAATRARLRDPGALHALELLELALEPLGDARAARPRRAPRT